MEEHRYAIIKSTWGVSINIYGQVMEKKGEEEDCREVYRGIWVKYSKTPLVKGEVFIEADRNSIEDAILNLGEKILIHSKYNNKTVIEICALEYCFSHFQQEGLTIAMMNWLANVFKFSLDEIKVEFDKKNNKYIFEY